MSVEQEINRNLIVKVYGASNIGKVRQENQDNFYINGEYRHLKDVDDHYETEVSINEPQLYAVFDGLGGEEGGQISSHTACDVMEEMQKKLTESSPEDLYENFCDFASEANERICNVLNSYIYPRGGTTFVAVQISDDVIHSFYLGDSRIYLGYDESMYLLTEDHTVAAEKVREKKMTPEEAIRSPENHMLTHFLGDQPGVSKIQVAACPGIKVEPGIFILLCSDGLHDMVSTREMWEILKNSPDPAQDLVAAALRNGGYDNVTPVVIRIEENN